LAVKKWSLAWATREQWRQPSTPFPRHIVRQFQSLYTPSQRGPIATPYSTSVSVPLYAITARSITNHARHVTLALASRFSRMLSFQIKDMEFTGIHPGYTYCQNGGQRVLIKNRGHNFGGVRHVVQSIICGMALRHGSEFWVYWVSHSLVHEQISQQAIYDSTSLSEQTPKSNHALTDVNVKVALSPQLF
jgi:hypothetical protein